MELRIQLEEEKIGDAVSLAIMSNISEEQRKNLIKASIEHLMTKKKDGYYGKTPIQEAFDMALNRLANKMVAEFVEKSEEVRAAVQKVLEEAAAKLMAENSDLAKAVAGALSYKILEVRK